MADDWVSTGERAWEQEARWGEWRIPNAELPLLADEMNGQRAIELGCGTGYVSAWVRRRGASVCAIDNSEAQLATARRLSGLHGLDDIERQRRDAEFNLPISSWMRLFHDIGVDVIDYIEIEAPESATGRNGTATAEWARRFPSEQVWRIRKR